MACWGAAQGALPAVLIPKQCSFLLGSGNRDPKISILCHPKGRFLVAFKQLLNLSFIQRLCKRLHYSWDVRIGGIELDSSNTIPANTRQQIKWMCCLNSEPSLHPGNNCL